MHDGAADGPARRTRSLGIRLGLGLAVAVVVVVAAAWAYDAHHGGITCEDDEGARRVPANAIVELATVLGSPFALIAGSILGALADRMRRGRTLVLVGLAVAPTLAASAYASAWSCDAAGTMCLQAVVTAALAALVLERATRPPPVPPALPTATAQARSQRGG